jgi:capsular polysaccharide transport system permease protein
VGAISERSEAIDRVWHTLTYLIFPLSGAVFMVDWLPPSAQELALWVPMVNGTEMVRDGYFGDVVRTHYSATYLVCADLVMTLIGLSLVRDVARRVEGE